MTIEISGNQIQKIILEALKARGISIKDEQIEEICLFKTEHIKKGKKHTEEKTYVLIDEWCDLTILLGD